MGREINEDKEFSEKIDRILAGHEVDTGEDVSEDFRAAIQFAQKLEELGDKPLPVFKEQLKRRLLLKLAEREAAAEEQRERGFSFWETLRNLVPRSPVWRTAIATVVVAVLAAVVFWESGIFVQAPEQTAERGAEPRPPAATTPAPAFAPKESEEPTVAMLDSGAILNLEPVVEEAKVYTRGEEIKIDLVFSNTGADSIILTSFPPAIQISRVDTGALVRSFAPGSESAEISASGKLDYTLVWDQLDDGGKPVEPGRYLIIAGDVNIQKGTEEREAQVGLGYVTEITIEAS